LVCRATNGFTSAKAFTTMSFPPNPSVSPLFGSTAHRHGPEAVLPKLRLASLTWKCQILKPLSKWRCEQLCTFDCL
jgi:hypothetical protein